MDAGAATAGGAAAARRATREAESATQTTRTYCMKATRRGSAPYSSASATMAEAPPGEEPQAAVEPGRMRPRVSPHPTSALASTVTSTGTTGSSSQG